jgi:hypothetical protein
VRCRTFDDVDPTQFSQISGKYKLYKRPPFTVATSGINQSIPPMNTCAFARRWRTRSTTGPGR